MQKKITETKTTTITFCDECGIGNNASYIPCGNIIQKCQICEKDICGNCAIQTDHWSLEDGKFAYDRPDHYCKDCWEKGAYLRKAILKCREEEIIFWEQWHKIND